ncbi:MAG: MarC family protein [Desulfurococcus sp.]|jgi:multiple antibiotic resistance protein|uniref:MarC family protein n=1 Tax=Desulfurococcus sp. TaxID=51678 RepID=UPI0031646E0A
MDYLIILLSYFTQLIAIMNPFSAIPTFMSLTEGLERRRRLEIVKKAYFAGLILVILFTLVGRYILEAFNISIASLRVGGGIILMTIALDMLGDEVRTKRMHPGDIAVVPIATPLIIGPGTITTILLLTSSLQETTGIIVVLIAGVIACSVTFLILALSDILTRLLSMSTVRAIGRFMALIISGVAVEMIIQGLHSYYVELFKG